MAIIPRREGGGEGQVTRGRGWDPFETMQELMRWDPFRELGRGMGPGGELGFVPAFEVKETKDGYVFKADLPGVKEEDIDLSLTGNRLTLTGKREEESKQEGDQYYTYERSFGSFTRSFTLPEGIDVEHVQADLKGGVLTINVPKRPEVQPKKISLLKGKEGKAKA